MTALATALFCLGIWAITASACGASLYAGAVGLLALVAGLWLQWEYD